jgi:hypothetical protein
MIFKPEVLVPLHMAYVEWYSELDRTDPNHGMFKISSLKERDGSRICSIVPLGNIQRSVHLIPKFGPTVPAEWTSSNVLDLCQTFFVNNLTDRHLFRTLYKNVE